MKDVMSRPVINSNTEHILAINQETLKQCNPQPSFAKTEGLDQRDHLKIRDPIVLPYDKMKNEDLPETRPNPQIFKTTRCGTNPLNPDYKLQRAESLDTVELKFIKDPLNVNDIPGARSKWVDIAQKKQNQINNRLAANTHAVLPRIESEIKKVIFSSVPEQKHPKLWAEPSRNKLDVTDIEKPKQFQMSKRHVNPVQPSYFYYDLDGKPATLEPIYKSTSSVLHKSLKKETYGLKTEDIQGATLSTSNCQIQKLLAPKAIRTTNFVADIENCKPGTLKKGIETKRQLNPLVPEYNIPDKYTSGFLIGSEYSHGEVHYKERKPSQNYKETSIVAWPKNGRGNSPSRQQKQPIGKYPDNDLFNRETRPPSPFRLSKHFPKQSYDGHNRNVILGTNVHTNPYTIVRTGENEYEFVQRYYQSQKRRKLTIRNPRLSVLQREAFQITTPVEMVNTKGLETAQRLDTFIVRRENGSCIV